MFVFRVRKRAPRYFAPASLALLALSAAPAQAQPMAPGDVSTVVTLTTLGQTRTDIDQGGRFSWSGVDLGVDVKRQFTPAVSAGVSARYALERWSFDSPTVFGAASPWTDIHRPSLGLSLGYNLAPDLSLFASPQVEWSYASGASASDGLNYGAIVGAVKVLSPTLVAGLGLGAFHQIDRNRYFPFFIVNWQFSESLRLSNPLKAGPAGGAGLELAYAWSDQWETSVGAAYREYRFRLDREGPDANGVAEHSGAPVFARLTRRFGAAAQVDLYAGVVAGGRLKLIDQGGATLQSSDYGTSPLLALSATFRF